MRVRSGLIAGRRCCQNCGTALAADNTAYLCSRCHREQRDQLGTPPPYLGNEFFDTDEFRAAFESQHIGKVLKAYRNHPRHLLSFRKALNQELLGRWLGLTQTQVSRLENGKPEQNLGVLQKYAEILHLPQHMLWFDLPAQSRRSLLVAGEVAAIDATLSSSPTPAMQALEVADDEAAILDRRPARLKFATASHVDDVLFHLRDQWHLLVKTDNLLGPRYAVRGVLDQLATIDDMLASVSLAARHEVVKLGAQYAESASWLYEDSGDLATAHLWNNRAMEWAHEADDYLMLSWTLFRRSQQAVANRSAAQVIGLAQAARRTERELLPPMRAAIAQQEAHGYALDGDEHVAQTKLDEAHAWAATDVAGDARGGHGSFCTASYIELQRAACWLTLGNANAAIQLYETTMPEIPAVYRRDRGRALSRLARAYVAADEPEQAARVATEALSIAESAGSTRTLYAVRTVGRQLAAHRQLPDVALLLNELTAVRSS